MLFRCFSFALVMCFVSAAYAEAPFQDITFDAALEKATAEKKVVMIDFYTTWCGPCKMLDKQTWPDEDVRTWINEHAIALKVDAEKKRDLAKRFKVRAYPTIVFVKSDGTTLDSIVGFRSPKDFIAAAKGALSGKPADVRAKEKFEEGDQNDPMERSRHADRLAQLGKHKEALEHYLWCFDEGHKANPAFVGVRGSFLLGKISRLGQSYPPAIKALEERRNRAEKTVSDFVDGKHTGSLRLVREASDDLTIINDELEENARTIKLYDRLIECELAGVEEIRRNLFHRIKDDLIAAKRYDDYLRDGDPLRDLQFDIRMYRDQAHRDDRIPKEAREMLAAHVRDNLAKSAGRYYEVYLGTGRIKQAKTVQQEVLDVLTTEAVFDSLIDGAVRAGRYDVLEGLREDAKYDLDDEEKNRIAKRIEKVLESPEAKKAMKNEKQDNG